MNERFIEVCEKEGWLVCDEGDCYQIMQYSPAGEDFSIIVSKDTPVADVQSEAIDFDPDVHVAMWIPLRGTRGVPSSISVLLHDAEEIEDMLSRLADALNRNGVRDEV